MNLISVSCKDPLSWRSERRWPKAVPVVNWQVPQRLRRVAIALNQTYAEMQAIRATRIIGGLGSLAALMVLAACTTAQNPGSGSGNLRQAQTCGPLLDQERSAFVIHEVRTGETFACNIDRAKTRFIPASTFKIPHALVALESAVVGDETEPFQWDGRQRGVAAWDQDTSLEQGVTRSTVWLFQLFATRLGHQREEWAVRRLRYGNQDIGGPQELRHFWLRGPLAISAVEQVEFLAKLRAGRLPFGKRSQARTVAMLRIRDCGQECSIYGKTGAVLPIDDEGFLRTADSSLVPVAAERTGWFVGWIERPTKSGGPVIFAHNLDTGLPGAMEGRVKVAYAMLEANGYIAKPID